MKSRLFMNIAFMLCLALYQCGCAAHGQPGRSESHSISGIIISNDFKLVSETYQSGSKENVLRKDGEHREASRHYAKKENGYIREYIMVNVDYEADNATDEGTSSDDGKFWTNLGKHYYRCNIGEIEGAGFIMAIAGQGKAKFSNEHLLMFAERDVAPGQRLTIMYLFDPLLLAPEIRANSEATDNAVIRALRAAVRDE